MAALVLILGGARGGKSALAVDVGRCFARVAVFATAHPFPEDSELTARIARHKAERPEHWSTVEPPAGVSDLERHVRASTPDVILVDCATLWLAWELTRAAGQYSAGQLSVHLENEVRYFVKALRALDRPVLVVSNEVGMGVVPSAESGRLFRDALGHLNVLFAREAEVVCTLTAGLALCIKDAAPGQGAVPGLKSPAMPPTGQPFVPGVVDAQWIARRMA